MGKAEDWPGPTEAEIVRDENRTDAAYNAKLTQDALDALKRLADAAEAYMGSDPDMPGFDHDEAELERALAAARAMEDLE
jgi:hypothetical protein